MNTHYNPHALEPAIQECWETQNAFQAPNLDDAQDLTLDDLFYCLSMFPYPSGRLHMGHVRNYTIGDVISRFQRMCGKKVLQPMGWDAFGLPAENAALKNKVAPDAWTRENITYMRNQFKRIGFGFDWSRELATCHPEYYRWEQWFFIKLYEKGLVYRKNSVVNWDPVDQTVLANEQVIDGKGWRSGAPVERREIPQWFLRITDYADELLADLDTLTDWPTQVITMQRNWIGKSQGASIRFELAPPESGAIDLSNTDTTIEVFTTRADTLMGVTYLAIAAQHPLSRACAPHNPTLKLFIDECEHIKVAEADMATLEKAGIDTGLRARHPLTGELLPVWAANFVISDYGTGAVMSVPGHDQRDWEFAKAYDLPIKAVIAPTPDSDAQPTQAPDLLAGAYCDYGVLIQSGKYDGLSSQAAIDAICTELASKAAGEAQTQFRLRDWGVSRQRYWGTPIPMIYCKKCGSVPVPEQDLPVKLPKEVTFDDTGVSPLKRMPEFINTPCPTCQQPAERETDTFDTFMESSWYYARFATGNDPEKMISEQANRWLPVDQYVGGIEHAVLHLLYSRFFHKLMRDLGLVQSDEPFKRLLCQGMVVAETYYREAANGAKEYFNPEEVRVERDSKGQATSAVSIADGQSVTRGAIEKMSKSKNNGVDPQQLIDAYGADTVRLFTMFASPPDQSLEWSDSGVEGAFRFLKKLWRMVHAFIEAHPDANEDKPSFEGVSLSASQQSVRRKTHQTIAKAKDDIGRRYRFNTAIAAVMELTNTLQKAAQSSTEDVAIYREGVEACILLLAPITPHICQQLWEDLGGSGLLLDQPWPETDASALTEEQITLVVQVNGKLRGKISVDASGDKDAWVKQAQEEPSVQKFITEGAIRKTIVVPGKLINFVVTPTS
jgi:leucyl-tRNA synthetase